VLLLLLLFSASLGSRYDLYHVTCFVVVVVVQCQSGQSLCFVVVVVVQCQSGQSL